MKRRRLLQSMAALPALPVIPASAQYSASQPASSEIPKLQETAPDAVANGVPRCFSAAQLAALRKLSDIVAPKMGERPGALDAGVPEFLDFLIGASESERQTLYRNGLERLNSEAHTRSGRNFAALTAEEAKPLLAPLTQPRTYAGPPDPYARFLFDARDDIIQATVSSREYGRAMSRRVRSAGGMNLYWLPLD
ncbi:MAG: gluconate 2-dehydrogenase subunit 3 family protein [Bryobacterales bacterium]|nr:gluconate 2-dehydrogenase subunit 3 family protein [Bryobacterales bacterium]